MGWVLEARMTQGVSWHARKSVFLNFEYSKFWKFSKKIHGIFEQQRAPFLSFYLHLFYVESFSWLKIIIKDWLFRKSRDLSSEVVTRLSSFSVSFFRWWRSPFIEFFAEKVSYKMKFLYNGLRSIAISTLTPWLWKLLRLLG